MKGQGILWKKMDIGKDFLSRIPAPQQLREGMDKWEYMKLKAYAQQKKWYIN
jgi:hypothetical protein